MYQVMLAAKERFRRFIRNGCKTLASMEGAASAMDIALDLVIGVVLALIVLAALKNLFNVNILPQVTDRITGMFS